MPFPEIKTKAPKIDPKTGERVKGGEVSPYDLMTGKVPKPEVFPTNNASVPKGTRSRNPLADNLAELEAAGKRPGSGNAEYRSGPEQPGVGNDALPTGKDLRQMDENGEPIEEFANVPEMNKTQPFAEGLIPRGTPQKEVRRIKLMDGEQGRVVDPAKIQAQKDALARAKQRQGGYVQEYTPGEGMSYDGREVSEMPKELAEAEQLGKPSTPTDPWVSDMKAKDKPNTETPAWKKWAGYGAGAAILGAGLYGAKKLVDANTQDQTMPKPVRGNPSAKSGGAVSQPINSMGGVGGKQYGPWDSSSANPKASGYESTDPRLNAEGFKAGDYPMGDELPSWKLSGKIGNGPFHGDNPKSDYAEATGETGQQLIDRLRKQKGETVAVRSKRVADENDAGNATADARNAMSVEDRRSSDIASRNAIRKSNGLPPLADEALVARQTEAHRQAGEQNAAAKIQADKEVGLAMAGEANRVKAAVEQARMVAAQKFGSAEYEKGRNESVETFASSLWEKASKNNWFFGKQDMNGAFNDAGINDEGAQKDLARGSMAEAYDSLNKGDPKHNDEINRLALAYFPKYDPKLMNVRAMAILYRNLGKKPANAK